MNEQKGFLSYDLMSIPNEFGIEKVLFIMKTHNIVFWDSFNGESKPKVFGELDPDKIILDMSTEEGKLKLEQINKILSNEL